MTTRGLTPSQAAVLLAVHRGIDTVDALAKALRVSREVVEGIVEELKAAGLLEEYRSGLILKRRRLRL
ncbi:MAG TPA: MarR family transcriptional regulator, partial [Pyrodictium sp.]|nr:MarR family transcriptional regulator [Pyrodictium sp.]